MWWLVVLGCASEPAPPPPPAEPVAEAAPEQPDAADAHKVPMAPVQRPGLLTEQEFAAAHELTGDEAPKPRGRDLPIGGSNAYLSLPKGSPKAGVLVIHEWWGLNDHIRHWADRLAEDGYAALAVDLYGGTVATTREEAMAAMKTVDDKAAIATLTEAHTFLLHEVKAPQIGVIGWCFGGGWSLRTALAIPEVDAAVMYYGRLVDDPAALAKLQAPVLGVFANRDEGIPPADVDRFEAAMHKAGKSITTYRYDADHAFANPSGARYDATSAEDAWGHVRAFLAEQLTSTPKPAAGEPG